MEAREPSSSNSSKADGYNPSPIVRQFLGCLQHQIAISLFFCPLSCIFGLCQLMEAEISPHDSILLLTASFIGNNR